MWASIAKFLIRYVPPEKLVKIFFIAFFVFVLLIGLLFVGPIMVLKHFPLGKNMDEFNFYIEAAQEIENATGIYVPWQNIMAIDAVLLNQDFSSSSKERALRYQDYFVREEQEKIEQTCTRTVEIKDSKGNIKKKEESYDCSYWITVYYERPYDETLQLLVADGKLASEKIEDVKRYTIYDVSPYLEGSLQLPSDWLPFIRDFAWPLNGHYFISSGFGSRTDPFQKVFKKHNGIDLPAATGAPVYATKDGKVIAAGEMGNAGNAVIIDHGGNVETRYYHLSKIHVKNGKKVSQGDLIGEVGSTGKSTGPHLHYEIRVRSNPVDPLLYYR
jgi:hypothetical protein